MASRQEEKERRRQERLEREQAEARAAGRRKRIQLVGGGLLGLAAIAAVAFALITALGGDDGGDGNGPRQAPTSTNAAAKIPEQQSTDVKASAKAAGCELKTGITFEGQNHADKEFTAADYQTNPPTSGDHNPNWYEDGVYNPGDTPRLGELVHTLEHGRIDVQYAPGTPKETVAQLETLVGENEGYHTLLFENTTRMPYAVAATAWTHMLGCKEMNPQVFDAIRTFRDEYIDKGPETVP